VTTQDLPERQPNRRSSERRQADKALRECEERYRALFDSVDCVYLLDFEGRFLDANPAALELLGYEQEEILTLSFSSLLDDDQLSKAMGGLAELKETGSQGPTTEFRLRRKTGEYVDVESKTSVILRDGQPYAVLGVSHDITERKRAEEALREREERFRRVSAVASDMAYSCQTREDGGFGIDWMAGATDRITGYSIEEIKAHGCWRFLVLEEDLALFDENVIGLVPGAKGACELRIRHRNGDIVWIASFAECFSEPQAPGRRLLYGGLADVTERKRAERELQIASHGIEHAGIGVMRLDQEGRIREANGYLCQVLGYSREELLLMTVFDVDVRLEAGAWPRRWEQLKGLGPVTLESDHRTQEWPDHPGGDHQEHRRV
jgi:PAS domain S-box-containing protein